MSIKKGRRAASTAIQRANRKSDQDFTADYIQPDCPLSSPWRTEWTHPRTAEKFVLNCVCSAKLSELELEACFALIEETSRTDYENSTRRWRPKDKRREMRSEDLRYILVKDAGGIIRGFTSLMPTYEEGQLVVYCYEVHLKPDLQGTGLGSLLLGFHYTVGYNLPPIAKVMLTCFLSNEKALRFYRKQGFEVDEISPEPRTLRGKRHDPDYAILSKVIRETEIPSAVLDELS